jgi:heat shock protein HslJ
MFSRIILVAAVFGTCFLAGCSTSHNSESTKSAPSAAPFSLAGTEWILQDLAGTPAVADSKATLAFPEMGRAAGNASCNRFTGSVEIGSGTIKFGQLASTRMACMNETVNAQETNYLKALGAATRYAWQDPYLLIYCEGYDKPLRFTRSQTPKS